MVALNVVSHVCMYHILQMDSSFVIQLQYSFVVDTIADRGDGIFP